MDENVKQTLELFQKIGIRHVVALTKFDEPGLGFVESMGRVTVGGFGVHALLYLLQQLQHIRVGVDGVPIQTRLQAVTYGMRALSEHQGKQL
jgi:hypothetical protein